MIGIGVGIDYALFVVTRHREHLHDGHDGHRVGGPGHGHGRPGRDHRRRAPWSSPSSAWPSPASPMVTLMGMGAALVVAVMVLATITLLPALLGFAGHRHRPLPGVPDPHGTGRHRLGLVPLGRDGRPPALALPRRPASPSSCCSPPPSCRSASARPTRARRRRPRPSARPTTSWPRPTAPGSTAPSCSPSSPATTRSLASITEAVADEPNVLLRRPAPDQPPVVTPPSSPSCPAPPPGGGHLPAHPPPPRRRPARDRHPGPHRGPDRHVRGHVRQGRQPAALVHRRRRGPVLPAPDGRVPLGAGPAQGGR